MGKTEIKAEICGADSCTEDEFLVDTGTFENTITPDLAKKINLPLQRELIFETHAGDRKTAVGVATFKIDDRESLPVPTAIGSFNAIGQSTLETLGYKVNPETREIEKTGDYPPKL